MQFENEMIPSDCGSIGNDVGKCYVPHQPGVTEHDTT
jgi:hypothetical protein